MKVTGLLPISLIDYPGILAAVIFTQGCNFRCPFCHNPELIPFNNDELIPEKEIFSFLNKRVGKLDGVSITGGEPLLQKDLSGFIKQIQHLGFKVKLDTNGSNPELLRDLVEEGNLDFIAMDIKTSRENYSRAIGVDFDISKITQSIEIVKQFKKYEFRITSVPGLVDEDDITRIREWLAPAKTIVLQQFINKKTFADEYQELKPYPQSKLKEFKLILDSKIDNVKIRGF
ncbi:anaerobic ribonucleoside-triphosphate reductase activating protein [Candidatus Dependentiae bacterium]|nr:anaerobic ribonucleoside-triphosphate reductase activating protein [Candidatus Dependentiae bacterium]